MKNYATHFETHKACPVIAQVAVRPAAQRHVDASCTTLVRLAQYLMEWGMTKPARDVAQSMCEYFDAELRHHRQEQERKLFPALRERTHGTAAHYVDELTTRLIAEHASIEEAWERLRCILNDIALCRPTRLSVDKVEHFTTLYRSHVAYEQARLLALEGMGTAN